MRGRGHVEPDAHDGGASRRPRCRPPAAQSYSTTGTLGGLGPTRRRERRSVTAACYSAMRYWTPSWLSRGDGRSPALLTPLWHVRTPFRRCRRAGDRGLPEPETPLLGGSRSWRASCRGRRVVAGTPVELSPTSSAILAGACRDHAHRRDRRHRGAEAAGEADRPDRRGRDRGRRGREAHEHRCSRSSGQLAFPSAGPLHAGPDPHRVILAGRVMNAVNFSDGVDGLAAGVVRDRRDRVLGSRVRPARARPRSTCRGRDRWRR